MKWLQTEWLAACVVFGVAVGFAAPGDTDGNAPSRFHPSRDAGTQGGHRGRGEGHMEMLVARLADNDAVREKLNITDEQLETLRNGALDLNRKRIDLRSRLEQGALEQARLMMATEIDEDALMRLVEQTGNVRTELAKLRVQQLIMVQKTLSQDQIRGLRRHMQDHSARRGAAENRDASGERRRNARVRDGASIPNETE